MSDFIIKKDYCEILIKSKKFGDFRVLIDSCDVNKCKKFVWSISKCGNKKTSSKTLFYATNKKAGLLHRFLTKCQKGKEVDHIDGDTLNNRRSNLRIVTSSQNKMNKGRQANNKSGYVGVIWVSSISRWMAYIKINKNRKTIGYYDTVDGAVAARKREEEKLFGEYRKTNER